MEIFHNFGIDLVLLIAQIINFLIVMFLLQRFLFKPIVSTLKKREETIKEGIKKSEEANIRLTKALEEEKEILRNAQMHARTLIEDAKKQIQERSKESELNAKKEAEKIIKEAREQIESNARETEKRLTLNIGTIAVQFLEKSLQGIMSEKEQKEIIKKAVNRLKTKR